MQVERHTNFKRRRGFRPLTDGTWTVTALLKLMGMPAAPLQGGGAVAIVEYGGGWYESDVQTAASKNGYPAPTIKDVSAGGSNSPGGDADTEVALDIQNVAEAYSVLTGKAATIYMIWADSDPDALAAVGNLIDQGVPIKAVSISWGSDEGDMGQDAVVTTGAYYQQFYEKYQIPVFVSSGDNDDGSGSTVDFPADLIWCVGCSGTTTGPSTTTVWNDGNGEGTGGGESSYISKPEFQKGVIADTSTMRTTGDVSSNADPNTGFPILVNGSWGVVGGTSASSPLFGGIFGAFNLAPQDIITNLYKAKSAFTPVLIGNNNPNGTGDWPGEICCGLGVPNVDALYKALTATVSPPVPPSPPGPVPPPGPPTPPPPAPPPSPPPPTTATLTGTATGTVEGVGPLHPSQPVNLSITGTVTIPFSPVAAPQFPSPEYCANMTAKRRPKSISITQWLQIITAILTLIQQILGGLPTGSPPPTAASVAAQVANHPTVARFKPASLTLQQWIQLITEILLEILPILVGSGA